MINFRRAYSPLNTIEISEKALRSNYQYLSQLSGLKIAPVLKSNAYGHGLTHVAKILDDVGAPFFCVDSLYEAYELLKTGIKTQIIIMGYTNPENLKVKKLPFAFVVYDRQTVVALNKYQPQAPIHIFIDTGMHREGITMVKLSEFLKDISSLKKIRVEGLMSHFAAFDQHDNALTKEQVTNFNVAQQMVRDAGFNPQWLHIGNSSASLHPDIYKNKIGNLIRSGIALYGIDPEGKDDRLLPALQVMTTLNQIKTLSKGEKVGYDFTYTAKKDVVMGILPYGYYDGIDRRLSNNGCVTIKNILCPIIGKVSMNLTAIDISDVVDPVVGDTVIIYSNRTADKNSFYHAAQLADTIPYDLLVHLAASTRRVIV